MMADTVSQELRSAIRSARTEGVRCIHAVVSTATVEQETGDGNVESTKVLELGVEKIILEDHLVSLENEFVNAVANKVLPEQGARLFLFRTDREENIEGSRWLLVTWIPRSCAEAERALYMRSRPLLESLVYQPHFFTEVFAKSKADLSWANVVHALAGGEVSKPHKTIAKCSINGNIISGPLTKPAQFGKVLERFVQRDISCIRLQLVGVKSSIKWPAWCKTGPTPLTVDAEPHECRNASHLPKSGLPLHAAFFATYIADKGDFAFVSWCPDTSLKKDTFRVLDEARCAVLRTTVLEVVLEHFPQRPERIVQINARDSQELEDAIYKATNGSMGANACGQARERRETQTERFWPTAGKLPDWPEEWPLDAFTSTMPSSLCFPKRLVPPWRGGSKAHTIGDPEQTGPASRGYHRSKGARH